MNLGSIQSAHGPQASQRPWRARPMREASAGWSLDGFGGAAIGHWQEITDHDP